MTTAEVKETEEIIRRLVNGSLVQRRYDKQRCEWDYGLHRLIVEYLQAQYQAELPQLMERVYKFYCTGKKVENPKTIQDIRPLLEIQYFSLKLEYYGVSAYLVVGELQKYLSLWGHWNWLIDLYKSILTYVSGDARVVCLMQLGELYYNLGDLKSAKVYLMDAISIKREDTPNIIIFSLMVKIATIEYWANNKTQAKEILLFLLCEIGDKLNPEYHQILRVLLLLIQSSRNSKSWLEGVEIQNPKKIFTEMNKVYKKGLEKSKKNGDTVNIATSTAGLGFVELHGGNLDAAEQ